ncbi:uncharacterized protein [Nicotiana sylvestris]|uniref:uncharacterized protein isoform X2 n=1 Tax=Nicotiana sylvestris TaxID=4096 RepID=UPI00388CC4D8
MVDKQISVRLPGNKIPRILRWTKFSNIAATSEAVELIKLSEKRDYEMEEQGDSALHRHNLLFIPENSGVVKNKPDQAILWEIQRLRTAIAKVQSDLDAFKTKMLTSMLHK